MSMKSCLRIKLTNQIKNWEMKWESERGRARERDDMISNFAFEKIKLIPQLYVIQFYAIQFTKVQNYFFYTFCKTKHMKRESKWRQIRLCERESECSNVAVLLWLKINNKLDLELLTYFSIYNIKYKKRSCLLNKHKYKLTMILLNEFKISPEIPYLKFVSIESLL